MKIAICVKEFFSASVGIDVMMGVILSAWSQEGGFAISLISRHKVEIDNLGFP